MEMFLLMCFGLVSSLCDCVWTLFGKREVPARYGMCSIRPLDVCQKSHEMNISNLCSIKDVGMQQKQKVPHKCEALFPVFLLFSFFFFHFRICYYGRILALPLRFSSQK